jgi:hypothetical protein
MKPTNYVEMEEPKPQQLPRISAVWSLPGESEILHLYLTGETMEVEIVLSKAQHARLYDFLLDECGPLDTTTAPPHLRPG